MAAIEEGAGRPRWGDEEDVVTLPPSVLTECVALWAGGGGPALGEGGGASLGKYSRNADAVREVGASGVVAVISFASAAPVRDSSFARVNC